MGRADAVCVSLAQPEIAEFGPTNAHRIFQHRLEHRLQFTC